MISKFNHPEVNIESVANGYVLTGKWNYTHYKIVCKTFEEVIEFLWRSYFSPNVGEKCPYGPIPGTAAAAFSQVVHRAQGSNVIVSTPTPSDRDPYPPEGSPEWKIGRD